MTRSKTRKILPLASSSLLLAFNLFFFGGFDSYRVNTEEILIPLAKILQIFAAPALALVMAAVAIGLLLPGKLHRGYTSAVLMTGILIWVQGNFIAWDYGLLDGESIDWTKNAWRGWVDGAMWVALLAAAWIFGKRLYKLATPIAVALSCSQLAMATLLSLQEPKIWSSEHSPPDSESAPPEEIFEFSSNQNVIHIIFDAFQSDIFQEIIDTNSEYYTEKLQGFTFFKETTGSYPTTYMSVPAFLGGQLYKNHMPMPEYLDSTLKGKTITNVLYSDGYNVDFVSNSFRFYSIGKKSNHYVIPRPYYRKRQEHEQFNSAVLLDLILFRSLPHFLKERIYNEQSWFFQNLFARSPGEQFFFFSHKAFLDDLIDNMSADRNEHAYKLLHFLFTHMPIVVTATGEFPGEELPRTRENVATQATVSLGYFIDLLDRLKALDIYDSSLIILHGDHGIRRKVKFSNAHLKSPKAIPNLPRIAGSAMPLMLIKPPHSSGPLETSTAHTQLLDLPATISSILDLEEQFDGTPMFADGSRGARKRLFFDYKWQSKNWRNDYLDRMDEYIIEGSVTDRGSWRRGATYYPPGSPPPSPGD